MKKIFYTAFYFCSALLLSSCIGDLDQYPHEDETAASIYTSAANYKAVLGKIYTAMVTTGQEKSGDPDLSSNSGQDYMRCFFNLQEYADNWTQQAIIESNGGSMLKNEGGKVKAGFDTPEAAEAYQLLADMVKDGNGLHATNEEGFQAYLSGKLGMVCTTIGKRANFEKSAKFKVMAAPFPQFEGKELKVPAGGNFLMLFSKDTDKQKAAWEFIKYIESPEALAKWSTGTGYLPPRKGVAEDPNGFKKMIEENKNIQVALSTMPNLVKWASFPGANGLQAEQLLIDARDIILSGKETAAQALHETAEKINNLL